MRKVRVLLIALLTIFGILLYGNVHATDETQTRNLGIHEQRPYSDDDKDGTVGDDTYYYLKGKYSLDKGYTIFKIYENSDNNNSCFYCLRGGVGFGATSSSDVTKDSPIPYKELGEMHKDADKIINEYKEKYSSVDLNRKVTINNKEVNIYNAILWILDEAYLPIDGKNYDESEYKQELFDKIGIPNFDENDEKNKQRAVTKDDIEVIQQLAIWYFANYDEQEQKQENKPTLSQSTNVPANFLTINNSNNIDSRRVKYLNEIYQYFINNAIENSSNYNTTGERNKDIATNKFDKDLELKIVSEDVHSTNPDIEYGDEFSFYKIGPFRIENDVNERAGDKLSLNNIVLYDAEKNPVSRYYYVEVKDLSPNKDNDETTHLEAKEVYYFVDENGHKVTEIEKGTNTEYYIMFKKTFEKSSSSSDIPEEEKYDMSNISLKVASSYSLSTATFLIKESTDQPVVEIEKEKKYDGDEISTQKQDEFDLSLRKFITSIKRGDVNIEVESRVPQINTDTLINGVENRDGTKEYTATYTHPKNALQVQTGDRVTYTIRIYNEGETDGTATKVTDYLPDGLEFIPTTESNINTIYGWTNPSDDGKTVVTEYLKNKTIKPFDKNKTTEEDGWQKATTGAGGLYYADLQIECRVVAKTSDKNQSLRNIAAITDDNGDDRDSNPGDPGRDDYNPPTDNSTYKEDDDDYENLILPQKKFDLSLRKYISSINGTKPEVSRVPQIDTSKLNKLDNTTGEEITTATYVHSKEPLIVKKGDIVTYKIRVYNEGQIDGYATKITDYLPDGLGFLYTTTGEINSEWLLPNESIEANPLYGKDGIYKTEDDILKKESYKDVFGEDIDLSSIQVIQASKENDDSRKMLKITAGGTVGQTQIKATDLIKAYGSEVKEGDLWQESTNDKEDGLFYRELEITCIVLKENSYKGTLKNIAEITAAQDSEGNEILKPGDDRDSEPNNVYEDEKHTPGAEIEGYTPGEQDDDDFEPLILRCFDLALRKFITGVETNGKMQDVTSRIPNPKMGEDENIAYEHSKDPVYVATNDTVIYTIRVFNEGTIAGYAEEITDDIPDGLLYLPEHDTNKQYEWVMIDKDGNVTENVEEAVKITTNYLSQAKEKKEDETEGRTNLINPFDNSKPISTEEPFNPDYKDVKIAFKVLEPNTSDRIITNSAQISEDSNDDEDSIPDEWNEGEDDQDREHIYVKYFDLSLLKWVTKTIVTVDGKTTTTETGFKPNTGKTETTGIRDNNASEPIAKVEIDRKKLDKTTVKFVYKIRVTNEGEIAGYASEITDFIPKGLEFLEEDNKAYGWTKDGDDKVTTRALETVLLQPGESAEVEITFTWKKSTNNLGVKTNVAEITEDYNDHNSKDIDSTPDNKKDPYEKEQEDDDDFALVILSIKTGKGISYTIFIISMITLLASGLYAVKKYVLDYRI